MNSPDTIYALSSGHLPSGVAIIRLSGPHAATALTSLLGRLAPARQAILAPFRTQAGTLLDRGITLFFPAPASFTGEDCAELHLHGGRAVVAAMLNELGSMDGMRHAEAGEFTRRAFLSGKLDLVETEGLSDLIAAETEAQRRLALETASGSQSKLYESWRARLIHARAMIEAELDFCDEGDVPGSVSGAIWADMTALTAEIDKHVEGYHRAEIVQDGFQVVILGEPNAGKSSLLNALARRDVAIVSDEPGTTRDLIDVALDLGGVKVVVTDTAGIREDAGTVEQLGINRARARAASADLVLVMLPSDKTAPVDLAESLQVPILRLASKSDLGVPSEISHLAVSAKTGAGIDELIQYLKAKAREATANGGEMLPVRLRHVDLLRQASKSITNASTEALLELQAEELRRAGDAVARISGRIDAEDLLDVIFSRFCIGK